MIEKVRLSDKFARFQDTWSPKIVGELNDSYVKLAKLQGEFVWHHHEQEQEAIDHLVGTTAAEGTERYPNVRIFNHEWHNPQMLQTIGVISRAEAGELSGGLLAGDVPVTLNRLIFDYDLLLICGPVFPHEVAGFSGSPSRDVR